MQLQRQARIQDLRASSTYTASVLSCDINPRHERLQKSRRNCVSGFGRGICRIRDIVLAVLLAYKLVLQSRYFFHRRDAQFIGLHTVWPIAYRSQ